MPLDPFAVVKECKGAALSILVLLATNQQMGGGAVTQEWLERHSGYTDKPVSQALAYLSETGRVLQTSVGWILPDTLPQADTLPTEPGADEIGDPSADCALSRNISDSPTTTTAIDLNHSSDQAAEEEGGVGIIPTRASLEHVEANLAAFKKWGVGRNEKTIVLSSRPEVTPQQIEDIARRLIGEKRFSTGLLITAVQSGDQPVPNLPNKYGPRQEERDPRQYAEWEK